MLWPRTFGSLNCIDPLDSVSTIIPYLGRNDVPLVEDSGVWLDAEDGWLDNAVWVLAYLVVEVLVLSAWSTSDDWLNIAFLGHVVTKLVSHIRVALHKMKPYGKCENIFHYQSQT